MPCPCAHGTRTVVLAVLVYDFAMSSRARDTQAVCVSPHGHYTRINARDGRGDSAQALSKPMWPLMRATPASLLAMREGIAAMRFPGHCQRWDAPRTRTLVGIAPISPQQQRLSPAMVPLTAQVGGWKELHGSEPCLLFVLGETQAALPDRRAYRRIGHLQGRQNAHPQPVAVARGERRAYPLARHRLALFDDHMQACAGVGPQQRTHARDIIGLLHATSHAQREG